MDGQAFYPQETRFPLDPDGADFPFRRELSLAPLVALWDRACCPDDGGVAAALGRLVHDELGRAPELTRPIDDLSVIARHRALVDLLMSRVFPGASWEQDYAAALLPFRLRAFYATPSFSRELLDAEGAVRGRANIDRPLVAMGRVLRAYGLILRKYYGLELSFDYPIIVTTTDPSSGLERHFSVQFDLQFVDVEAVGPLPQLDAEARRRLVPNLADPATLTDLLPPDRFVFRGFMVLKAQDVTDQEVLSSIKRELIEKESIVSTTRFQRLQAQLCTLLRRPGLRLGLAAIQGDQVFRLNYGCQLEQSCIFQDSDHMSVKEFAGTIYERAVRAGQPLIIEDLTTYPQRTAIEEAVIESGVRNIAVAPLFYQDQVIGTLELGSATPGDLTAMGAMKLREVLPLFSMAVRRSLEELETRIQAVIKEKCTAIHPSVEWRFRQAVLRSIEQRGEGAGIELEPIVFQSVYPLYGVSDIRGSSLERNLAIQADLTAQLRLAREVVRAARDARALPILDELGYRIDRHIDQLAGRLASGDEVAIVAFLREHVEPLLEHLTGFGPAVRDRIQAYRDALDPGLGTVYRQRKDFEESVTLIGETLSAYLDAEEEMAQAMFPHYFEKQRTDGVDHTIYVGASLVESGVFHELYLRNLRLWQLMIMCGAARRTHALRGRVKAPLDTTHLILVQHTPLAIRFRFDEKRFDVDGAYNVRYEVIKKRIDKAVIRGTGERLTQPGRLAVVYSHAAEAREYRQYLEYLQASGYLTGDVEEFELEELQGMPGLRALRVAVELEGPQPEPRATAREAAEAVRTLTR